MPSHPNGVPLRWQWCIVLGSCAVFGAAAGPAQAQSGDDFICTSPTERREVRVVPGCRVEYIKNHSTTTLWSSHDAAYCAARAAALVTTLVKANFSCKTETTASAERLAAPASDED